MRTTRRLLAVLPLLAIAVAGCGGGGGGESTASATAEATEATALSKAELITQGNAICAEVNAAVGSAGSTSAGNATVQVAGLYTGMVERLKELGPPREESAGYSEFISSAEALVQAEDNVKLAYEREEGEAMSTAAAEVSTALSKFESAAEAFGLEKCAEAPSAPTPSGAGEAAGGGESSGGAEAAPEEAAPEEAAEAAPEEGGAAPVEEESAGGGAGVGGGTEGGGAGTGGGSSGGIGPG
jgi:hypothetical protein